MSLEAKIEALTHAVVNLQAAISKQTAEIMTVPLVVPNLTPQAPVAPPVAAINPIVVPPAPTPAAGMPPLPTFTAPAAPVSTVICPFNDPKGLIDYVMNTYKALGPQKGTGIQGVMVNLGYQNINDVKPEHYQALYTGIEALKKG